MPVGTTRAPLRPAPTSPARFGHRPASDATPFVGRSNEYGLLIGLVARLAAGTGTPS